MRLLAMGLVAVVMAFTLYWLTEPEPAPGVPEAVATAPVDPLPEPAPEVATARPVRQRADPLAGPPPAGPPPAKPALAESPADGAPRAATLQDEIRSLIDQATETSAPDPAD